MMLMRETNHQQESSGNDLDRLLDAALAKYADANPRAGLEDRILANLRSEQAREATASWWKWGLAAAVAVVALLAVAVSLQFGRTVHPVIANHPAVSTPDSPRVPLFPEVQPKNDETTAHVRRVRRTVRHPAQPANVVADSPKLDHFPSPQPLTEQEKAALEYVEQFPEQASLMAQAQAAFAKQEELEKNSAPE